MTSSPMIVGLEERLRLPRERSLAGRMLDSGLLALAARVILGVLFVWMGYKKSLDPVAFLKQVRMYHMLPESPAYYINSIAIVLPYVEIVCGAAVLLGLFRRGGAVVCGAMLAMFTPAILLRTLGIQAETGSSFFSIRFDCGCGAGEVTAWIKLLENTGLFLLSAFVVFSRARLLSLEELWRAREKPLIE